MVRARGSGNSDRAFEGAKIEKNERDYEPAGDLIASKKIFTKRGNSPIITSRIFCNGIAVAAVILQDLMDMLAKYTDADQLPRHVQKKADEYIQSAFVINGLLRLMLEAVAGVIPFLLLSFNLPELMRVCWLLRLAMPAQTQRLQSFQQWLNWAGILPPSPIRFWNDKKANGWMWTF